MDSKQNLREFTVPDASGQSVKYQVVLHGALTGMPVSLAWMRTAAPAMDLIGAMDGDGDVGDLSAFGDTISKALASPELVGLIRDTLSNTMRAGKALSNDLDFDAAYLGNYMELYQALWNVIRLNRFLPLPGTSKD